MQYQGVLPPAAPKQALGLLSSLDVVVSAASASLYPAKAPQKSPDMIRWSFSALDRLPSLLIWSLCQIIGEGLLIVIDLLTNESDVLNGIKKLGLGFCFIAINFTCWLDLH